MGSLSGFLGVYLLGGLTFVPLVLLLVLLHAHLTFPTRSEEQSVDAKAQDELRRPADDANLVSTDTLAEQFHRTHEGDVAAGYFAVCREYVPGGVNGKPPERTTPAGEVVAAESPSVYQSMYRSIFDRKQQPTINPAKSDGKPVKKARNVFFVVLRLGHLMLFDDAEQLEVRHVISLQHHTVSIYGGGQYIPEGELWVKRNAICLSRKQNIPGDMTSVALPFYLFSENCSDKEDFYFALLRNQEKTAEKSTNPPVPQKYEVKHIVGLVQRLHSSGEQLQTRWINALIGRLFLALYKTPEAEDFVRKKITKKISRVKKPNFISKLALQKIDLGDGAPLFTNPRLKDLTVDGDCTVEADITYTGNFRIEIAATARIDLGSRFKAREVDMVLAVVLKKLEGHAMMKLKPPPSNRMWITFETMPAIDMRIEPIVSSRQITYNIILRAIESRIREVVAETLVMPHWDDIPFMETNDQHYRGGIWARDHDRPTPSTEVPNEEPEDEAEAGSEVPDPKAFVKAKEDRTMSLPVLAQSPPPNDLKSRRSGASLLTQVEKNEAKGASTGFDKDVRKHAPRVMRSGSFTTTAADPVLSTKNVNIESVRGDVIREGQADAASSIMAIASRSKPSSPADTPVGSPPNSIPAFLEGSDENGKVSMKPSEEIVAPDSPARQGSFSTSTQPSTPSTPNSLWAQSPMAGFGNNHPRRHSEVRPSSVSSSEDKDKKPGFGTLGSATVAAKKWGWGVLSRNDAKSNGNGVTDKDRAGTPGNPMGRGKPLPPPGTPLPPPERSFARTLPIGIPKRRPVPPPPQPPQLPERKETVRRPVPKPPLPKRRAEQLALATERTDGGLLIVEAPSTSEPTTPVAESHPSDLEMSGPATPSEQERAEEALEAKGTNGSISEEPLQPRPALKATSSSIEDKGTRLPSWSAAQEEDERARSIWLNDSHEQS